MRSHNCIAKILLSLSFVAGLYAKSPSNYSLVEDWRAFVGPRENVSGAIFRLGVCPDGSSYLSNGLGRLIRVNPAGQKVNDESGLAPINTSLALACDDSGRAIVGTSRSSSIITIQPQADGAYTITSQIRTRPLVTPFDILPLPGQAGYVILGRSVAQSPIHLVSLTGDVKASFDALPAQATPDLSIRTALNGTLVRDEAHQSILYFPENPYVVAAFTPDGQLLSSYSRAASGFHPVELDTQQGLPLPNDRIVRAAVVGTDDLLIQVVNHRPIGPMTVSSSAYLEVVDKHLQPKSNRMTEVELGHLWGSDKNGNVYFTIISPGDGMNVIKAHVARSE